MYHVLVPVDGNADRARSQVDALSRLGENVAELRADVLYVYEEIDVPADEAGDSYIDEVNRNLPEIQGRPETIDSVRDTLEETGADVEVNEVRGEPAVAILEIAEEFDVDAIVLGTRRRTPVGKVLFGSVTQSVILKCDRPVLTTPQ